MALIGCETRLGNGKLKKIVSTKVNVSFFLTFLVSSELTLRIEKWFKLVARGKKSKMGCFFSKKSKRKSAEKEDRTPTATTVESTTTSNAVPLGNNTDEAPKQYSWDKREKVRSKCKINDHIIK